MTERRSFNTPRVEILAPGGDADSVKAAILAGAQAVYLGLAQFNARRRAANISEAELQDLVLLAHQRGARIYVTANILVVEEELPAVYDLLCSCLERGADGFIVQDYGVLYLLKTSFPGVEVHASTQLTTHSREQVRLLKALGVKRVNLCREMSLAEVRELTARARELGVQTEVFAHGAYCACFSGQCYLSSFIGGQSGNRGVCAQPCRRRYWDEPSPRRPPAMDPGPFRMSLKDLNALKLAPELIEAGVAAFKIEGRMKDCGYVYNVVRVWQEQLERIASGRPPRSEDRRLERVFNRGFSAGYLEGCIGTRMRVASPLDLSQEEMGRVAGYDADERRLRLDRSSSLRPQDWIAILTLENLPVCEARVEARLSPRELRIRIEKELKGRILPGQLVMRQEAEEESQRLKERLAAMKPTYPVLAVVLRGRAGEPLQASFRAAGRRVEVQSPSPLQKASSQPLTGPAARRQLEKLGGAPWVLGAIDDSGLEQGLFLPVRELNELRRRALEALKPYHCPPRSQTAGPADAAGKNGRPGGLALLVSSLEEARRLRERFSTVLVEIADPCQLAECGGLIPWFPSILFDPLPAEYGRRLDPGRFPKVVSSHSGLGQIAASRGIPWVAGPYLNLANSLAMRALQEAGQARGVFYSPELNAGQIRSIPVPAGLETWLTVFGPILLATFRQCFGREARGCSKAGYDRECFSDCRYDLSWYDEKGKAFHVVKRPWSDPQLYNDALLSLPAAIATFRNRISFFLLDLRDLFRPAFSPAEKIEMVEAFTEILEGRPGGSGRARARIEALAINRTSGHYRRGLS